jgi:hypothetical protein
VKPKILISQAKHVLDVLLSLNNIQADIATGAVLRSGRRPFGLASHTQRSTQGGDTMNFRACLYVFATTVILAACIAPTAIQAQNCFDYTNYLRWRGRVDAPAGLGDNKYARGVTVVGDRAYLAASTAGLAIFDVIDPENPVLLGVADTPGSSYSVVVEGNYAYVADWYGPGFCVIDVTDPSTPSVVGTAGVTNTSIISVAVVKPDTVFVVDTYYGVRMVDVSDPANPDMYGGIPDSGGPWDLDVEGVTLYLTNNINQLRIYDVTTCVAPELIEIAPLPGPGFSVDVVGNYAYVACEDAGLQIVDISNPENPQNAGHFDFPPDDLFTGFYKVHVVGDLAYLIIGDGKGVAIVDVSYPTAPYLVNTLGTSAQNGTNEFFVDGDYAYLAAEEKGLFVANVSNTASPSFTSSYVEQDFFPQSVAASGDYAYVLDQYFGLRVMDITTAPAPTLLATVDLPGAAYEVGLDGGLAYVADNAGGLQIVDIADPNTPEIIGSIMLFGTQDDVDVQGTFAYLASPTRGLQIVDVSDPTTPVQRGQVNPPGTTTGVAVDGDHAYLACQYNGLQVADITNPNDPTIIGELDIEGWPEMVHIARGHAFLCAMEDGLYIVDIANPAAPELVSILITPGNAWDVVVDGDLAYIADIHGGLQIADITDLSNPRYLGCVDTPYHIAYGVALAGDRVCIADWEGGLHVIWKQCVPSAVPENYVLPSSLSMKAFPNPFNPRTTIAFDLPEPGLVTLRVFDVAGRIVRELIGAEDHTPGRHEVVWNGRDDAGRQVASGTYFGRLELGQYTETKRMVMIK